MGTHRFEIQSTDDGGFAMNDETGLQELQARPQVIKAVVVPVISNRHSTLRAGVPAEGTDKLVFPLLSYWD